MVVVTLLLFQNGGFEFVVVGAREGQKHRFVFDEYKCGHRGNVIFHCQFFTFVYIHLKTINALWSSQDKNYSHSVSTTHSSYVRSKHIWIIQSWRASQKCSRVPSDEELFAMDIEFCVHVPSTKASLWASNHNFSFTRGVNCAVILRHLTCTPLGVMELWIHILKDQYFISPVFEQFAGGARCK